MQDVAIGELGNRLEQRRRVHRRQVHLAFVHGGLPCVLVHIVAVAAAQTGTAAIGEGLVGVAHEHFDVLIGIHAVQVDRLFEVRALDHEVHVHREALQCARHIVVIADVEVVAEDLQRAGAGAHAAGVKTVEVFGALGGVADERPPAPIVLVRRVAVVFTYVDGEGTQCAGLLVARVRAAGAHHDVELAIEFEHLVDAAATVDVGTVNRRQVVETRHVGDHFVRSGDRRRVRRHQIGRTVAVLVDLEVSGDQRVVE